jgi:hypothetical protein
MNAMNRLAGPIVKRAPALINGMFAAISPFIRVMSKLPGVDKAASPFLDTLDIAGYNYAAGRYVKDGKKHPGRVIVGTEEFNYDLARSWELVKRLPYLIGGFVWPGWDYLGGAGIGDWAYTEDGGTFIRPYPWLSFGSGAVDLTGNIGSEAAYALAVWGECRKPYICCRPLNHQGRTPIKSIWRHSNAINSWSWKGCEGRRAYIEVYSAAPFVRLELNGRSLGRKRVRKFRAVFHTSYAAGELKAIALDANGRKLEESALYSAEGECRLSLSPEKETASAGDVIFVHIAITGANGVTESNADRPLRVTVTGAELLGLGSANPRTAESFRGGSYTTYYGRALAVIRMAESGRAVIVAESGGLSGTAVVKGENCPS